MLPYRSIFAVLTWDSVIVYDTVQDKPICIVKNLHYSNLSDATWSRDGQVLVVSSTDGYLSMLHFEAGELGKVYQAPEDVTETATPNSSAAAANNDGDERGEEPLNPATVTRKVPIALNKVTLPPCDPGKAQVEAPPMKKAKTRITPTLVATPSTSTSDHKRPLEAQQNVTEGVDQLTIRSKKKKRIQPILVSAAP